jgi:hypothetical protein
MIINRASLIFFGLICISRLSAFSQTQESVLFKDSPPLPALEQQVQARFGKQYNVFYVAFDSVIGIWPNEDYQGRITDPYRTLTHLVFFVAALEDYDPENEDSTVIGFYRDEAIVWCSGPTFKGSPSQVFCTQDLNADGQVDIVTLWGPADTYVQVTKIYILSWDGKSCRAINDFDSVGESNLLTSGSILRIYENKAGRYDLHAYWPDDEDQKESFHFPEYRIPSRPWVKYYWNGTKYVLYMNSKP